MKTLSELIKEEEVKLYSKSSVRTGGQSTGRIDATVILECKALGIYLEIDNARSLLVNRFLAIKTFDSIYQMLSQVEESNLEKEYDELMNKEYK